MLVYLGCDNNWNLVVGTKDTKWSKNPGMPHSIMNYPIAHPHSPESHCIKDILTDGNIEKDLLMLTAA